MATNYKLIPQISTSEKQWSTKVIVAGKQPPKIARNTTSRYQNILLMDLEGNKITAILYDANITALADELKLGKTYLISNATVKDNKNEFKGSLQDKIWNITGKTKIEELHEDNLSFMFSKYELTPFDKLEQYMDTNTDISIMGIAIELRQKRIIQTHFGTEACLQDVILTDKDFQTVMLTMWDTFVDKECVTISENLLNKPIIWATNLKVSSYNGITLSTKVNSTFFINPGILPVADYREWIVTNEETLDEMIESKASMAVKLPKISPPDETKLTSIVDLQGPHLGKKFYWIKAQWKITSIQQRFWYLACSNCKKASNGDFGEIYKCRFCKFEHAKTIPRANVFVHLQDESGGLDASMIGEIAETLLEANATDIMNHIQQNSNAVITDMITTGNEEEELFYLKVTPKRHNPPEYRYEIIFSYPTVSSSDTNTLMKLDSPVTSDTLTSKMTPNDNPTKSTTRNRRKKASFQILDETSETGLKKKMKISDDPKENPK